MSSYPFQVSPKLHTCCLPQLKKRTIPSGILLYSHTSAFFINFIIYLFNYCRIPHGEVVKAHSPRYVRVSSATSIPSSATDVVFEL